MPAALTAHRESTKAVWLRPAAEAPAQLACTAREMERRQHLPAALTAKRVNGREARGSPAALYVRRENTAPLLGENLLVRTALLVNTKVMQAKHHVNLALKECTRIIKVKQAVQTAKWANIRQTLDSKVVTFVERASIIQTLDNQ